MDKHDACEQAYLNGYEAGKRDAAKHGEWISQDDNKSHFCLNCGKNALWTIIDYNGLYTAKENLSDYCHNCGAKMDGERKDDENQ